MDKLVIEGGRPLSGSIKVSGSKNSALPIMAATLLTDEPCIIRNVPHLRDTQTIQRLLVDPVMQASIRNKAVVIDEYGLLSIRQVKAVVDLAEKHHARLVLVGDSGQHKSVEAGDAARIVERESRATVAKLREVRRQSANPTNTPNPIRRNPASYPRSGPPNRSSKFRFGPETCISA